MMKGIIEKSDIYRIKNKVGPLLTILNFFKWLHTVETCKQSLLVYYV